MPVLKTQLRALYRVKSRSVLNQSAFFHVTKGLGPDIMHDVLEGVMQYEMKLLIQKSVQMKTFTADTLNSRIKTFNYRCNEVRNKPSPILKAKIMSNDNSLTQSGRTLQNIFYE